MTEHILDAKNKKLGRLASEIASLLQGKNKATYNPQMEGGTKVVVKNAANIILTGRKTSQKIYYKHAGQLGHLKKNKFEDVFRKNPAWILRHAVNLMLPKNKLRAKRIKHLIIEK